MQGGASPSRAAFEQIVGGLLDDVAERAPGREIRAFGEMVDLLCERGASKAAAELEELWNDLGRRRRFSLLCGYHLDVFDRASQVETLPDVCRAHSHVLPASDSVRLARSVDLALEEVLGAAEAGKVYALVGEQIRRGRVPVAAAHADVGQREHARARGPHPGVGAQALRRRCSGLRQLRSRGGGTRTPGLRFWRPPLYQLSYAPMREEL